MIRLGIVGLSIIIGISLVSCQSQEGSESNSAGTASNTAATANDSTAAGGDNATQVTTIQFEKQHHDFGKVEEGQVYKYRYKFKNTGTVPLKIQSSKGSCGCTTSDWSKEPVPPGGEGYVEAQFDSKGRAGTNNKHVTVICNTNPKQHKLTFTAEVVAAGK